MAVKAPPILFAWISVIFLALAWVLLLAGVGALQAVSLGGGEGPVRVQLSHPLAPVGVRCQPCSPSSRPADVRQRGC